jgi:uncharacterized protein with GYD domain
MPKYLLTVSYATDGVKGLLKEGGSARQAAAKKAAKSLGGKVESFYFALGEADAYVIVDMPDNASAAAISLALGATGLVIASTTVLMSCEEMDEAVKKSPAYRGPGE